MRRSLLALALALIAACSDPEPALSDATSLQCPSPGALPFRLSSRGFQNAGNRAIATENPRIKDEAADTLGNPGGATASVYLADDARPAVAPPSYRGAKARTLPTAGPFATALAGENVSLWHHDAVASAWQAIGRGTTGADGSYEVAGNGFVAPIGEPVYAVLEADGSCAEHFDYLLPRGARVVVTDIDGTLTTDDAEFLDQLVDAADLPAMKTAADRLMQAWSAKGYPIVYLTARMHVMRAESRGWLADLGFPAGPLVTAHLGNEAGAYKTRWLQRMIQDLGWNVVVAYGNAASDILAYESAGIPKDRTFIIGPLAGDSMTQPILADDYTAHISAFVAAEPDNPGNPGNPGNP